MMATDVIYSGLQKEKQNCYKILHDVKQTCALNKAQTSMKK